ncbi:MAG TPA: hypothetical protein VGD80_10170 [Kofleriaceae bacterium]
MEMNLPGATAGNDAGWHLHFFTTSDKLPLLSVGAGDYYANIEATLPSNLDGGSYSFSIEGITNNDYKALHTAWSAKQPLYVDLYLYWRDIGGVLGYLANVAGVSGLLARKPSDETRVARLLVTRLSRRVGARRYEAAIEACERVWAALRKRPAATPDPAADPRSAAVAVAKQLLSSIDETQTWYKDVGAPAPPAGGAWPRSEPRSWRTGLDALGELERSMVAVSGKGGRGMYLIRDGVLHIGARAIPLGETVTAVSESTGLVHVETAGVAHTESAPGALDTPPARVQYSLILKGRPDLRPGDKISFRDPLHGADGDLASGLGSAAPTSFATAFAGLGASIAGGASALSGEDVELYVSSVSHKLSRTEGFVTTLTGVVAPRGSEWDPVNPGSGAPDPDPVATPHGGVASAIKQLVKSGGGEQLAVGEVRAATLTGTAEPPSQTIDVWVGTAASDGGPSRARRLAIDHDAKSRASGVAYATPFAWGKCGLVLPRYPGTRVLLGHVDGRTDDPVELGAIWESGHGPDSQAGDWWLILPAAVAAAQRQSAADTDTPAEPSGHASNDLIDADGARVIEVGRLTVRVQPKNLAAPGTRPPAPSDSAEQVTIEHENGSRIVIKDNGDIVIHSAADLTLSADKVLTLSADSVAVKVAKTMDVGDP